MITVKIPEYGSFKLLDAKPEDSSVGDLLPGLAGFEKTGSRPSLLRLAPVDGEQPLSERTAWVDFMRHPRVGYVAATLVDDEGREAWLFLAPHRSAPDGEFYTWMVVHSLQIAELRGWVAASARPDAVRLLGWGHRGKLLPVDKDQAVAAGGAVPAAPELTAAPEVAAPPEVPAAVPIGPVHVAAANGAVAAVNPGDGVAAPEAAPPPEPDVAAEDEDDEDAGGADDEAGWDGLTPEFQAACKQLKGQIRGLTLADLTTPRKVKDYFFPNANGKAARLLAAWRELFVTLGASVPDYDSEDQVRLLTRLEADLAKQQALPVDQTVLAAVDFLRGLGRVHLTFKGLVQELRIRRARPYVPVNYRGLAKQLAREMSAFKEAAREAAVHEGVFGTLVENRVHELVRRWVQPASLSSGAVAGLRFANQIDGIIWDHRLMPAVVEQGNVAVVEANSIAGIFELKASRDEDLGAFTLRVDELREHMRRLRQSHMPEVPVLGLLIQSPKSYDEVRLLTTNTVTVLLHQQGDDLIINENGVFDLLRFVYEGVIPVLRGHALPTVGA